MSVHIKGVEEILQKLESLGQDTKAAKSDATKKAADYLKGKVETNAPADGKYTKENQKYGTLKQNIDVELEGETAKVHTGDAYWANFLEYGTKKMGAQPFMEKSLIENKSQIQDIIMSELKGKLGL